MVLQLQVELAPGTAVEEALVATIAITQWRTTELPIGSPNSPPRHTPLTPAFPSRLMKMFSKAGDPSEALARLHRLKSANQRQWHNSLKELRLSKETRNRAETGQNPTAYNDIVRSVERTRAFCESNGLLPMPVDDSNPIPAPNASQLHRRSPPFSLTLPLRQ